MSSKKSARRIDLAPITQWITAAALQHGSDLPAHLMQRLAISRRRAGHLLAKLVAAQWLTSLGTPRRPRYQPGPLRQVVMRYPLAGLQEDVPWRRDFAPCFELPAEVRRLAQHAFTELVNNAIDHSGGSQVTVSMRQTPLQVQLLVSDDGVGLFDRVAQSHGINEPQLAMLELSKGRLTSAPGRHLGQGLFTAARVADVLDLHANRSAFQCRAWESHGWRHGQAGAVATRTGTAIYVAITVDTQRTLQGVLRELSVQGDGMGFDRTRVPLRLLAGPEAALESRAEARRVAERLSLFRRAELDFAGIDHIGPGFADELFRVIAREQPEVSMVPLAMAAAVRAMAQGASERV
jgi:anti-sigma regulatory factor (Ser/Thr protein kinase)